MSVSPEIPDKKLHQNLSREAPPSKSSERKNVPTMIFYEQAEKDMNPDNVIVIPPAISNE